VAGTLDRSISTSRYRNHITSRATSDATTYSTSHVDRATMGCLLDPQAMGPPKPRNRYPLIDLQVDISPAQSESV
jgi:hypothetical protein